MLLHVVLVFALCVKDEMLLHVVLVFALCLRGAGAKDNGAGKE